MTGTRVQSILFWLYFAQVFYSEYTADSYLSSPLEHLQSVLILTTLTVFLPWAGAKAFIKNTHDVYRSLATFASPIAFTTLGFVVHFLLVVQPNYPTASLASIIHLAFLPGILYTILMALPSWPMFQKEKSD